MINYFRITLFNAIFTPVVCLGARATVQASHWLLTAKNRDQSHATVHDIHGDGIVTNGGLYSSTSVFPSYSPFHHCSKPTCHPRDSPDQISPYHLRVLTWGLYL